MSSHLIEEPRRSSDTLNILLAEDDRDDQELIREALKEIAVFSLLHVVENGNDALAYLNSLEPKELPGLIILDYNMPELNGAQVLQKLYENKRYAAIPKVVLSTSNNVRYVNEAKEKCAQAYLIKPSDFASLVNVLREILQLYKVA